MKLVYFFFSFFLQLLIIIFNFDMILSLAHKIIDSFCVLHLLFFQESFISVDIFKLLHKLIFVII